MQLRMAAAIAGLIGLVLITLYWPVEPRFNAGPGEPGAEVAAEQELLLAPPPDEFPGFQSTALKSGGFVQPIAGSAIRSGVTMPALPQAGSAVRPGVAIAISPGTRAAPRVDGPPETGSALRRRGAIPPARPVLPEAGSVVKGRPFAAPVAIVAAPEAGSVVAQGRGVPLPLGRLALPVQARSGPAFNRFLALSPDGLQIASGHTNGQIDLFDAAAGTLVRTIRIDAGALVDMQYAPDGTLVALGTVNELRLYDSATGRRVQSFRVNASPLQCFVLVPDGESLVGGCDDGKLMRVSLSTGKASQIGEHGNVVTAVAASPTGRLVASGGRDLTVRVWNLETPAPPTALAGLASPARHLAFSPQGDRLAAAGTETRLLLWQLPSGGQQPQLTRVPSVQLSTGLVFERDGLHVLASGSTAFLRRIRLDSGVHQLIAPEQPNGAVRDLALSSNGQTLAVVTTDGSIQCYRFDPASGWSRNATLSPEASAPGSRP